MTKNLSTTKKSKRFLEYIQDIFSLDTRSLAILRIGIGVVILVDLLVRYKFLTAFHTDLGILPQGVLLDNFFLENIWSVHTISPEYSYQVLLFGIHALVCLAFIAGWKTRTMSFLLWVLTLSMHGHNPLILNGGDTFTRLVLFWGMFLPWGHQRSLDNYHAKEAPLSIFSLATVGFICQLCYVYIFSAILKDHPRWISEFSATYYALSLDSFRTNTVGTWIYQYPGLMKFFTASSYYLESIGLVLLVLPRKKTLMRMICIGLFVLFHLGLGLGLYLYSFPWIMIFARCALVPTEVWDNWIPRIRRGVSDNLVLKKTLHYQQQFTFIISALLIGVLLYSFAWNLRTTDFSKYDDYFPKDLNRFGFLFRIDQYWNMFAPYPFMDNGWIVIEGITQDGRSVNMIDHDLQFTLEEPENYKNYLHHERWRKYYTSLYMKSNSEYRQYGANYLCHHRNSTHLTAPDQVISLKRYYFLQKTLENYEHEPLEEILLYEEDCP